MCSVLSVFYQGLNIDNFVTTCLFVAAVVLVLSLGLVEVEHWRSSDERDVNSDSCPNPTKSTHSSHSHLSIFFSLGKLRIHFIPKKLR